MEKSDKDEVAKIVQSELKKFVKDELDKEMEKILHKKSSKSRQELIDTIKDSLESAFKILWVKRDFWKTDIK